MRPLVNEEILRRELAKLESEGVTEPPSTKELELPPTSAHREVRYQPIGETDIERLRAVIKEYGLELINDGAVYRIKRQRDFTIWTLAASPLVSEERGGGEAQALLEAVRRFCEE